MWVTDLTFVAAWAGVAYVCFITAVFSRMAVGWRAAGLMRTSMVLDCLEMARWGPADITTPSCAAKKSRGAGPHLRAPAARPLPSSVPTTQTGSRRPFPRGRRLRDRGRHCRNRRHLPHTDFDGYLKPRESARGETVTAHVGSATCTGTLWATCCGPSQRQADKAKSRDAPRALTRGLIRPRSGADTVQAPRGSRASVARPADRRRRGCSPRPRRARRAERQASRAAPASAWR